MKRFYNSALLYLVKAFSRLVGQRYYTVEYRTQLEEPQMEDTQLADTSVYVPVSNPYLAFDYKVKGTKLKGTIYAPLAEMMIAPDQSLETLRKQVAFTHNLVPDRVTLVDTTTKRPFLERVKYTLSSTALAWGKS